MVKKHIIGLAGTIGIVRNEILDILKELLMEARFKNTSPMVYQKDNLRIGVATKGNYGGEIFHSIRYFESSDCQIIITPCLTWGNTHWAIVSAQDFTYEFIYIYRWEIKYKSKIKYAKQILEKIYEFQSKLS